MRCCRLSKVGWFFFFSLLPVSFHFGGNSGGGFLFTSFFLTPFTYVDIWDGGVRMAWDGMGWGNGDQCLNVNLLDECMVSDV